MWKDISTAPVGLTMFVVKAFNADIGGGSNAPYTSDPWCVWQPDEGQFCRWPHDFSPTHWCELPEDIEN